MQDNDASQEASPVGTAIHSQVREEFRIALDGPVADDDDFFAAGGTSLSAAILAMRLTARLGRDVSIADILRYRTPGGLTQFLSGTPAPPTAAPAAGSSPPAPSDPGQPYPLAPQQRWYVRAWHGESLTFGVVSFTITLPDGTPAAAIRQALVRLAGRHDSLRTCVSSSNGEWTQRDVGTGTVEAALGGGALRVIETAGGRDHAEKKAEHTSVEEQARGILIDSVPLFRASVVYGAGTQDKRPGYLVLIIHHIIFDGMSFALLERDLLALLADGEQAPWRASPYHDYAVTTAQDNDPGPEALQWWQGYLHRLEAPCHLPERYRDPDVPLRAVAFTLPQPLFELLAAASATYCVPGSVLRVAAALVLVHVLCDTGDASLILPVDGRPGGPWHDTIGMFEDLVLVRHRTRASEQARDFVAEVARDMLSIMEYHHYGFDRIITDANVPAAHWRWPVTGFGVNSGLPHNPDSPRIEVPRTHVMGRRVLLEFLIFFTDSPGRTDIELQYRAEFFRPEEGEFLLSVYLGVLCQLTDSPELPVESLLARTRERLRPLGIEFGAR